MVMSIGVILIVMVVLLWRPTYHGVAMATQLLWWAAMGMRGGYEDPVTMVGCYGHLVIIGLVWRPLILHWQRGCYVHTVARKRDVIGILAVYTQYPQIWSYEALLTTIKALSYVIFAMTSWHCAVLGESCLMKYSYTVSIWSNCGTRPSRSTLPAFHPGGLIQDSA